MGITRRKVISLPAAIKWILAELLYLRCTFGQPKFVRSQTSSWKSGRIKSPGSREPKWLAASIGFEHKSAAGRSFWQNMLLPQLGGAWHVWFLESALFEVCFLWKASSGEWSLCPNQSAPDFGRCLAYMTVCGRIQRICFLLSNQTCKSSKMNKRQWTLTDTFDQGSVHYSGINVYDSASGFQFWAL